MKQLLAWLIAAQFAIDIVFAIILGGICVRVHYPPTVITDTIIKEVPYIPEDISKDLPAVLDYYNIKYPHIVYAQAVLETGHFKSYNCTENNNLFGLYDSKNKRYFKFKHWTQSVKAYRDMIQYKYKDNKPSNDEEYYKFLVDLGYAEDTQYIYKVKNIVKRHE